MCILLLHTRAVYGGARVFGKGYLAVEFFLMLSGFLMAYAQETRVKDPAGFMAKRYLRLWPTMALGGVIGLPRLFIKSASLGGFFATAIANLALLPAWWGKFVFALNIPAWTIFYELVANTLAQPETTYSLAASSGWPVFSSVRSPMRRPMPWLRSIE